MINNPPACPRWKRSQEICDGNNNDAQLWECGGSPLGTATGLASAGVMRVLSKLASGTCAKQSAKTCDPVRTNARPCTGNVGVLFVKKPWRNWEMKAAEEWQRIRDRHETSQTNVAFGRQTSAQIRASSCCFWHFVDAEAVWSVSNPSSRTQVFMGWSEGG